MKRLLNNIAEGMRQQPLPFALVIVNLAFLVGFTLMFREVSQSVERKDALVIQLLQQCASRG
jgi:hypothetical protein